MRSVFSNIFAHMLTTIAGMAAGANLAALIPLNPGYHNSWWKVFVFSAVSLVWPLFIDWTQPDRGGSAT